MLHVRQGRWQRIPGVRRAHTPGGRPAVGARHTRPEAVLLPPDDPVARRADRRGSSVRLIGPSLHGRVFTAAVLRVAPRVRGVAWFGLGDLASSGPQEILPAWGAGDSGSNPDGPNRPEEGHLLPSRQGLPCRPGRFLPRGGTNEDGSILSGCEPCACGKLSSRDVPRCPDGTFIPSWTIVHPESGGDALTCPLVACGPDLERDDGGLD